MNDPLTKLFDNILSVITTIGFALLCLTWDHTAHPGWVDGIFVFVTSAFLATILTAAVHFFVKVWTEE